MVSIGCLLIYIQCLYTNNLNNIDVFGLFLLMIKWNVSEVDFFFF